MKKHILNLLSIFMVLIFIFSTSCKEEEYDFDNINPKLINGISGVSETYASGLAPVTFNVDGRGGSSFVWAVNGSGATITQNDEVYEAYITFDQSDIDLEATVSCTETTAGGVTSETVTKTVALYKFKAMAFDEFLGEWVGTETDGAETWDVSIIATAGAEENTIVFSATDGIPALMGPLFTGWGETFQPGFGNEGNIIITLDLSTGGVNILGQYFGQTLPGPWDYWFSGTGSWEGINRTMTIDYGLHWDDTYSTFYNASTVTLSKQE